MPLIKKCIEHVINTGNIVYVRQGSFTIKLRALKICALSPLTESEGLDRSFCKYLKVFWESRSLIRLFFVSFFLQEKL
jgi:hypothetical protein